MINRIAFNKWFLYLSWASMFVRGKQIKHKITHRSPKREAINYNLLFKFPSRQRPDRFFSILNEYYQNITGNNFQFVCSFDNDDESMNNRRVKERLSRYENLKYFFGENKTKVQACNANMEYADNWDICILVSDDMHPVVKAFDEQIRKDMNQFFRDTDGVLWYNDNYQRDEINTLVIVGKKYYERFNYLYHPAYKSLRCDVEFTEVSLRLNKVRYNPLCIIEHRHPVMERKNGPDWDDLYIRNEQIGLRYDHQVYNERKANSFDLK